MYDHILLGALSSFGVTLLFFMFCGLWTDFVFYILKPHRKAIQRNRSRKWWLVADVVLCPCVCKSSWPGRPEWCKGGHPGPSREDDSKCEKLCLAQIPSLLMWPKGPAPSILPRPKWLSPPTARSGTSYEPSPSCCVTSYVFQFLGQCDQCFWTWPLFQGGARILFNSQGVSPGEEREGNSEIQSLRGEKRQTKRRQRKQDTEEDLRKIKRKRKRIEGEWDAVREIQIHRRGEVDGSGRYKQGGPGCKRDFGVDPDVIVIYACKDPWAGEQHLWEGHWPGVGQQGCGSHCGKPASCSDPVVGLQWGRSWDCYSLRPQGMHMTPPSQVPGNGRIDISMEW